ncbi:YcxB family protein [Chryseobacterium cheonjiense]|uniref:YcxB family protein n=1 Tax=Chryseobacterium cheonjiense TaxID=2728845 RepID=A0A7Y0A3Y2_9FLAO|nr:YcxB family protein [Chryseobacterium cheonjiense]NML56188.1 YcxB family protein [Chryseobacterium cheonjiense]
MMTVKTLITFQDFLMFHLKSSLVRLIAFPLMILLFFIMKQYADDYSEKEIWLSASMWLVIMFLFVVIRSFFRLKFAFKSNKKIQEYISYNFTDEKIQMKGETFDEDFTWNSIYKVKENKDWFLIYQTAQTMNMVPKKFFTKDQILEFRDLIRKNNVKAKLRND